MRHLIGSLAIFAIGFLLGLGCSRGNPTPERVILTVHVDEGGVLTAQPNWPEVVRQGAKKVVP